MLRKESLQFRRDRKMVGMSFFAPVFQLIILGYAANLDVQEIPLAVCDLDRTASSRQILERFTSSGYFRVGEHVDRLQDVDELLDHGTVSMVLVIPRNFGDDLTARRGASLQLLVDGSETNSATVV